MATNSQDGRCRSAIALLVMMLSAAQVSAASKDINAQLASRKSAPRHRGERNADSDASVAGASASADVSLASVDAEPAARKGQVIASIATKTHHTRIIKADVARAEEADADSDSDSDDDAASLHALARKHRARAALARRMAEVEEDAGEIEKPAPGTTGGEDADVDERGSQEQQADAATPETRAKQDDLHADEASSHPTQKKEAEEEEHVAADSATERKADSDATMVKEAVDAPVDAAEGKKGEHQAAENDAEPADVQAGEEADAAAWEGGDDVDDLVSEHNMLGEPIHDWDEQRETWLEEHPAVARAARRGRNKESMFMLTGTQPFACKNPEADHLLLRCFKNKVDYCRRQGIDIFYNMALLDPDMPSFWAKLPVVRGTMLAHPEADWIWWLDADAVITDMEFEIPLERYKEYNMVMQGWEGLVFEKRSWLGLNAGSFLLRNCQWSMDLLERWASMGPQGPMGAAYRNILSDFLPDRDRNPTDDQAALVYLMIKEKAQWASKIHMELDFFLSGYWVEFMDGFEATEQRYRAMEAEHQDLASMVDQGLLAKERLTAHFAAARETHLRHTSAHDRRPFITHFTGCQPCSGHHNPIYTAEQCTGGLMRALNYGDDQVLRTLGFKHLALEHPHVQRAS